MHRCTGPHEHTSSEIFKRTSNSSKHPLFTNKGYWTLAHWRGMELISNHFNKNQKPHEHEKQARANKYKYGHSKCTVKSFCNIAIPVAIERKLKDTVRRLTDGRRLFESGCLLHGRLDELSCMYATYLFTVVWQTKPKENGFSKSPS